MTQPPGLQRFVRKVPDGEAISLGEFQANPPYEISLLADCGPLFVILLEDYWVSWSNSAGTKEGRRCADFAVVNVQRRNLVFLNYAALLLRKITFTIKWNR